MINFDWENSWTTSSRTLSEQRCERKILVIKYALLIVTTGLCSQTQTTPSASPEPSRATAGGHKSRKEAEAGFTRHDPQKPPGWDDDYTNPRSEIILLMAWHISTNSHCSDSHANVLIFRRNLSGGALFLTFCMTAFSEPNPSTQDIKHYPWINHS